MPHLSHIIDYVVCIRYLKYLKSLIKPEKPQKPINYQFVEPQKEKEHKVKVREESKEQDFGTNFEEWQIDVLTDCINDSRIFSKTITSETMNEIFFCTLKFPLINDKNYFAIGFQNDIHGYELRNKYFKGCTSKAPTTNNISNNVCKVFEGFTDYLSYLTLKNTFHLNESSVILNSISNLEKAKTFMGSHNTIITYLDNDEAGQKATAYLKFFCKNLIDKSSHYSDHKDLNDYLKSKSNLKNNWTNDVDENRNPEQTNTYRRKR